MDQRAQSLEQERHKYEEFVRTHPKSRLDYNGQSLEYISCGHGSHTVFIPPHISRLFPPEMAYRHILDFESKYRIIAPSLIESDNLDDMAASLLAVIEKEGVGPVVLYGQSGSGITAQVFFRRHFQHVAGMVLVNTVAPGRPAPRSLLFSLFKLLPTALLKYIFKKKLLKLLDAPNLPPDLIPKLEMNRAILIERFAAHFSKRMLALDLQNVMKFNMEDIPSLEPLTDWHGQILIVTSEDDPGYNDSRLLSEKLPNAHLLVLEKGYGHLAPAVKSQEVYQAVDRLIAGLSQ